MNREHQSILRDELLRSIAWLGLGNMLGGVGVVSLLAANGYEALWLTLSYGAVTLTAITCHCTFDYQKRSRAPPSKQRSHILHPWHN